MKKIFLIIAIFIFWLPRTFAQTTNYTAYALILVNVAKYAEWPDNGKDKFLITIIGKSKVYDELAKRKGYLIKGKAVEISQVNDISEIAEKPQIIYISDNKSSVLEDLQAKYATDPIMFISEREGLYKKGASLSFIIIGDTKLRFDVNKSDILRRNLKISSNLLAIANEII